VKRLVLQPFDLHLDWFAPGLFGTAMRLQPDVILCMGRMSNCYGAGLQADHPRAPVIGTMRTGKRLPWLFRRSLRKVRHIVANSRDARDRLVMECRIPPQKIAIIYNSLVFPDDESASKPTSTRSESAVANAEQPSAAQPASVQTRDSLRSRYGDSPSTHVLLCVAMFRPEKRQRELIDTVIGLPPSLDWQLWLAGDGPTRDACQRAIASHPLRDRIKFVGFHRDPVSLYRAADVAVHASSSESLSNFLIEAQAHGLPVVAYEAQGITECFVPDETGWAVEAGDRIAFRTALERLMNASSEERAKRAAAARAFARTTFDTTRQVSAYLELFEALTRAPRS
jgi:glycosyltransferase involved in cell wall biosynthesis